MREDKHYLGIGWGFPVSFDKRIGVVMIEAEEDIHQSLRILFPHYPVNGFSVSNTVAI
ncbi:MAG: hypothetical protein LIP01_14295 [Tannerellaceae bacterium]|nr:hypothetical protein [Tannerellaceae bacterium]